MLYSDNNTLTILELKTITQLQKPHLIYCAAALRLNREVAQEVGEGLRHEEFHCFVNSHAWAISRGGGSGSGVRQCGFIYRLYAQRLCDVGHAVYFR